MESELYFPHEKIRNVQSNMIADVQNALNSKKHIIMHAPTGIGKTIASLAPALPFAMKKNLTIFFLTSRHTQHKIVVDSLKQIKQKFNIDLGCADIIGKKAMCLQNNVEIMASGSFHEYCKSLRDENKCEFYTNTRKQTLQPTFEAKIALEKMKIPLHVQDVIEIGKKMSLCPYELAVLSASEAKVIVADYYYMFNTSIRNSFLLKAKKELQNCILIVDEAHNLPSRARELLTQSTSSLAIEYAMKEAQKYEYPETAANLHIVEEALFAIAKEVDSEAIISKNDFVDQINRIKNYDTVVSELLFIGEDIRDKQKRSFVLNVAKFLEAWLGPDKGFGRIVSKYTDKKIKINLTYRCLDPSIATKEVFDNCYSSILMSGTLTPTEMYKDILGFGDNVIEKEYKSPFPKKNRLNLIIPKTTTKFVERSHKQYNEIAAICADVVKIVNGKAAIFFPSYDLMQNINEHLKKVCHNPIFMEKQRMIKEEKENMLASFRNHPSNSVLLGVSTGSFGEGIDMPNVLKAVIIVGLPLQKPDPETKLFIEYYGDKFEKGVEYGYILPAITKCLQNAGRCIRSETDKGAIIFLDERYTSPSYYDCFPSEWDMEVETDYSGVLKEFLAKSKL